MEYYNGEIQENWKEGEKMEVCLEIKKYLEENGISQAHVGKRAGLNLTKLNMALNGNRKMTLEEYAAICGVLGVNTDFFLKPRLPSKEVV